MIWLRNRQPHFVRWVFSFLTIGSIGMAASGLPSVPQSAASGGSVTSSWGKPQDPNPDVPFWGEHQGCIVTKPQHFMYFAAFDLATSNRDDVIRLLKAWTAAAVRMFDGETAQPLESGLKLAVTPAAPASRSNIWTRCHRPARNRKSGR